ncbi:SAM-dependent methyltransferase [Paenibacillus phyllosphaerae]|uniref:SAM-dependent methyltransferase n=1 Tax=Paenibacillus phyllosphaerae TaxID=274593 RepID=A0A7W5AUV5_9BACL|nr:class I SAM-dependent methyltransferase [Paenibacillus phyllosphaerae]MBB3108706.1 SAM-dependent methyltransferase [Paenibacillus phyllosphaerae]
MGFLSVLSFAHRFIEERVSTGDTVIDATCGNGVDTRYLAELIGPRGTLYGFDIQEAALQRTAERLAPLAEEGRQPKLRLILGSHADMREHVDTAAHGQVGAIMFNFGYLPGADPSVITQAHSSIAALEAALALLRPGGIVTAVLYPGHEGGDREAAAIEAWASVLPQAVGQAIIYRMIQKPAAPYLIAVEKRK